MAVNKERSEEEKLIWEKFDPNLLDELVRTRRLNVTIPVTIECVADPETPEGLDIAEMMEVEGPRQELLQRPIMEIIEGIGIKPENVRRSVLSNSLDVSLPKSAIFAVAELDVVKMIRFVRPYQMVPR